MKRIILVLTVALVSIAYTSCGGDDDTNDTPTAVSSITMKVNNQELTFDTIAVVETNNSAGGTNKNVTATIGSNTDRILSFTAPTINSVLFTFRYTENNVLYAITGGDDFINSIVSANTDTNLTGSFSGELSATDDSGSRVIITDGNFSIDY